MKINVMKVDMSETNTQLGRIADYLQAICSKYGIVVPSEYPKFEEEPFVAYTDEYSQIVQEHKNKKDY